MTVLSCGGKKHGLSRASIALSVRQDQRYMAEHDIFPCGDRDESRFSPDFDVRLSSLELRVAGDPYMPKDIFCIETLDGRKRRFEGPERQVISDLLEFVRSHDPDLILIPFADTWVSQALRRIRPSPPCGTSSAPIQNPEVAFDSSPEIFQFYRLVQIIIHIPEEIFTSIIREYISSVGYDSWLDRCWPAPTDFLCCGKAIHFGHQYIHEYQVVDPPIKGLEHLQSIGYGISFISQLS
jgi:hypothetical protein